MTEGESQVSKGSSYEAIGEYWDAHELANVLVQTEPAEFEVDIRWQLHYVALETDLSEPLRLCAARHGVSPDVLANQWLRERLAQDSAR